MKKYIIVGDQISIKTYSEIGGYTEKIGIVLYVNNTVLRIKYFDNYFNKFETITFEGYKVEKTDFENNSIFVTKKDARGIIQSNLIIEIL